MQLKFKLLSEHAKLPTYATDGSGAFDFYAITDEKIGLPNEYGVDYSVVAPLGLSVEVPKDYTLLIFSRSGHGFRNNVRLANCVGVIDSDYRGELMVKLVNDSPGKPFFFELGDRIAQGLLVHTPRIEIIQVETLSETARGEGGFGSTGN